MSSVIVFFYFAFVYNNNTKNSEILFFNFDGYCGVAADRRRDLGWNPSTLTVLNSKLFFFH
jgi:hypothetical protein